MVFVVTWHPRYYMVGNIRFISQSILLNAIACSVLLPCPHWQSKGLNEVTPKRSSNWNREAFPNSPAWMESSFLWILLVFWVSTTSLSRKKGNDGQDTDNQKRGQIFHPGSTPHAYSENSECSFLKLDSFWTSLPHQQRCVSASWRTPGFQKPRWRWPPSTGLLCGNWWPRRGHKRGLW